MHKSSCLRSRLNSEVVALEPCRLRPVSDVDNEPPTEQRFVLILDQKPKRTQMRLLGPGATLLDDLLPPTVRIRFDWPAPTLSEAIVAAIHSVEATGRQVLRVDIDDCVTVGDIALRIGLSRETVRRWANGQKGPGSFPQPVNPRRDTLFYSWTEMLPWLRQQMGFDLPEEEPAQTATNYALQLRALMPRLPRPKLLIDLLDRSL